MRTVEMEEAKTKAAATYNAAADSFDEPALSFWDLIGRRTIDRLRLKPGDRVLDVACGSGASALPAAQRVGSSGAVLGIDLAERLLELARAKARRLGLTNIEFRAADMERSGLADESFDAVVCVFGILFVPDMAERCANFGEWCAKADSSRSPPGDRECSSRAARLFGKQ